MSKLIYTRELIESLISQTKCRITLYSGTLEFGTSEVWEDLEIFDQLLQLYSRKKGEKNFNNDFYNENLVFHLRTCMEVLDYEKEV